MPRLTTFTFLRIIYSQNRHLRGSRIEDFVCGLNMLGKLTENTLKVLVVDFTNWMWQLQIL